MEPRPQSTRAAQPQPTSRQPAAGRPPEEGGPYQQPDPTAMVAPPRTDYDYSPLDLAPPGQRRRRQLVAAALGGLLMLVLVAAIVFAFLVLRDPGGDDGENDIAAAQTQIAATDAAQQASTPDATEPPAEETQAAGAEGGPTATAGLDAAGEQAAVDPTQPAAAPPNASAGPTSDQLMAMLPAQDIIPLGLDQVADSSLTKDQVVAAVGGNREAETRLNDLGWSGNAQRSFTAADPAVLPPDATTDLTVSLHGFGSDAAAAEALTFYSDVLLNSGYQEIEVGEVGATNRLLVQPQEDGGTTVALYVQQGPVLYRVGGYSPAGDPTTNVVTVAQAMIAQQAAASGQ
jgi:hypothetical protein